MPDQYIGSGSWSAARLAKAVLLDLDGTLLDTAPDLIGSLNELRLEQGLDALAAEPLRPVVSEGGAAMIQHGFAIDSADPGFEPLRRRYLTLYRKRLSRESRAFPGMDELLAEIEARNLRWGVVTNKPGWLTRPLLAKLGYLNRAACVISGDDRALHKPHPYPVQEACRQLNLAPAECVMVGDAQRDIEAARLAGARSLVALFGYIATDACVGEWGADGMIEHPMEILPWLEPAAERLGISAPAGGETGP